MTHHVLVVPSEAITSRRFIVSALLLFYPHYPSRSLHPIQPLTCRLRLFAQLWAGYTGMLAYLVSNLLQSPPQVDFPSIAFQASLATGSLLFAAFGLLYTVYATYAPLEEPPTSISEASKRRPIIRPLIRLCRAIAALLVLNMLLTGLSAWLMKPTQWSDWVLAGGLFIIMVVTTVMSVWLARHMR